jgi:hypothetical protein
VGLQPAGLGPRERSKLHTVSTAPQQERLEGGELLWGGRGDDLRDPPVRDPLPGAELVERTVARDAEPGLQGVLGVVEPGVDDLAVAARGFEAVPDPALEDHEVDFRGEARGDREAHDARSHDRDTRVRHQGLLTIRS